MNRNTYLTVLSTPDYLNGVVILYISIRRVSDINFVVLCNEELPDYVFGTLSQLKIPYIVAKDDVLPECIEALPPEVRKMKFGDWEKTFFKLKMFELTQYDKICYLDSDMIVTENIDDLFDAPHMSAVPDSVFYQKKSTDLNSGTLVFIPEEGMVAKFLQVFQTIWEKGPYPFGDQNVVSQYFADWHAQQEKHLQVVYNAAVSRLHEYAPEIKPKVIHYANHYKPWNMKYGYIVRLSYCLVHFRIKTMYALLLAWKYNILSRRAIKKGCITL